MMFGNLASLFSFALLAVYLGRKQLLMTLATQGKILLLHIIEFFAYQTVITWPCAYWLDIDTKMINLGIHGTYFLLQLLQLV